MAFYAKGSDADFERKLPSTGLVLAVCVDVIDLGMVTTPFKNEKTGEPVIQRKARIVWEVDEKHPDFDGPHRLYGTYTVSLNTQANLRKMLEQWRGQKFVAAELKDGFDLETLVGVCCQINIAHSEDGQWANVDACLPAREKLEPSGNYKRRDTVAPSVSSPAELLESAVADDELPF